MKAATIPAEDKDRPLIVHALALLIQHRTGATDDVAIGFAWEVFELFGRPKTFPPRAG